MLKADFSNDSPVSTSKVHLTKYPNQVRRSGARTGGLHSQYWRGKEAEINHPVVSLTGTYMGIYLLHAPPPIILARGHFLPPLRSPSFFPLDQEHRIRKAAGQTNMSALIGYGMRLLPVPFFSPSTSEVEETGLCYCFGRAGLAKG